MATTRQIQIPGGPYVNEVTDSKEFQIPGAQYINEDTAAAAGAATIRSQLYQRNQSVNRANTF